MRVNIPSDLLTAALLAVSKEETRYYIRGVFLDPRGYIVSTDGHRAFFGKLVDRPVTGIIIPTDAAAQAVKAVGKGKVVEFDIEDGKHWLTAGSTRIFFIPVDGTFPQWDRAVPSAYAFETETAARFDPKYYADIGKMAKALTGSTTKFMISHKADMRPCGVNFSGRNDCAAVLMSLRDTSPKWSGFSVS